MKVCKRVILVLIAMVLCLNFPYIKTEAANKSDENKVPQWKETKSKVNLLKTATDLGNGEYEISLKMKGNKRSIVKPVDIIMVIDKSGSMKKEMPVLKSSVGSFLDNIQNSFGDNAKVSVITFSGNENIKWSYYYGEYVAKGLDSDAQLLCDFNSNYSEIKNKVNELQAKGGTDTEAALKLAYEQLNKIPVDHKKYVVLFTDGIPIQLLDEEMPYSNYYVKNVIIPETEFYFDSMGFRDRSEVNFYSIGMFSNKMNPERREEGRSFINYINNSGAYFITDNSQNLNSVYNDIAKNIIDENKIMEDAKLTDVIPKNFEVVENAYGEGKTSIVTELNSNSKINDGKLLEVAQPKITKSDSGEELLWSLGTVNYSGIDVRFKIKLKDSYFGGKDIHTNTKANVNFYDPLDPNKNRISEKFNIPKVDIPYKEGTISLSKELVDENGKPIDDCKYETFTVCLDGGNKGKYYMKIFPNGKAALMKFFIRDTKTDISNNKDLSKNYLIAGEYKIKEMGSLNNNLISIKVNGKEVNKDNAIFNLDKDNKDIKIVIRNIQNKNNGFDDHDKIENSLGAFEG
ncbi:VWA domain-containing protein [Clostridium perfringens]|nr:VWA domain-containing protein [Clostridium perfringens]MDM0888553.1 VWA domain-containing protein [Clostridium perfringens]MDM0900326.1 VWA domain-containing protein [Clostridium perfringens]MDM0906282.1 VWA domain-containing protein [Clostridium perfringens]MDM0909153.1 VWA domain-containing protein [Clostridium perfringens]